MGKVLHLAAVLSVCFDVVSLPANSNFLALTHQTPNKHNNSCLEVYGIARYTARGEAFAVYNTFI